MIVYSSDRLCVQGLLGIKAGDPFVLLLLDSLFEGGYEDKAATVVVERLAVSSKFGCHK